MKGLNLFLSRNPRIYVKSADLNPLNPCIYAKFMDSNLLNQQIYINSADLI